MAAELRQPTPVAIAAPLREVCSMPARIFLQGTVKNLGSNFQI